MLDISLFIGKKYGYLTIIELHHKKQKYTKNGCKDGFLYYFKCKCECGNYTIVNLHDLVSNHTLSCGCLQKKNTSLANRRHGLRNTKLFSIYSSIKQRCLNSNCYAYKNYGERGIKICKEWENNFKAFYDWAIANGYKEDLTIDRINNNGNYEPNNCRWVTQKIQCRNYRRNHLITYNNETKCLIEWSELYNIEYKLLHKRLYKGWDIEKALLTPVRHFNKKEG